jgi:putative protein kinase ArgK-like GTPase of G3E family
VILLSSKTGEGLDKAWEKLEDYQKALSEIGEIEEKRALQRKKWMWNYIQDQLLRVRQSGQFVNQCALLIKNKCVEWAFYSEM